MCNAWCYVRRRHHSYNKRDKDISVSDYTQQTNEDPVLGKLKGIISVAIERAS